MELAQLTFSVSSEQLLKAKESIDALAVSMHNLNNAQSRESKTAKDSVKSKESLTKTTDESTESTKKNVSVLERQQAILEYMTQGFSKGQSSVLAYAKASGALTSEIKELGGVLQTQRRLIGGDTFDKSMSGLVALKNQYGEIKEAIRQYNSESGLTRNQTRELTRDKERLIEKMKLEGATFSDVKNAVRDYNSVYTEQAAKVNSLIKVERERERSAKDFANAIRNVQSAEERLFATVQHINEGMSQNASLNERAALAVGSYERNLRLAGITGESAAKKLMAFKSAQAQITASEQKRQSDYVARGVGTQMGDVGVSLAGGMNPLLVMIQQGDQLRGLIQQAGRDGLDLKNVMNDAARQIAVSFKDVGIAVGTFVGGAFVSAGKAIKDAFIAPAILAGTLLKNLFSKENLDVGPNIAGNTLAIRNFMDTLKGAIPVFASFAAILTGAFVIAMVQSSNALREMNSQILQFGASLGVTLPQAKELAATISKDTGTTFASSMEAVGKFAKSGITDFGTLNDAVTSAIELQKVLGIEVEKTAERFAAVAKDPVKGLIEIAKDTGLITEAQIRQIDVLEKTKGKAAAVKAAMDLVSASMKTLATEGYESLTSVEKLWIDIKKAVSSAWGAMQTMAENTQLFDGLRKALAYVNMGLSSVFNGLQGIVLLAVELSKGNFGALDSVSGFVTEKQIAVQKEYLGTLADIAKTSSKTSAQLTEEAKTKQQNAIDANSLDKRLKEEEKARKKELGEAEREAARLRKQAERDEQSLIDLKNKYLGKIEQTTEAEQKYRSILDSDMYQKYNASTQESIRLAYEAAKATEIQAKGIEALAEVYKAWMATNKSLEGTRLELENQNVEISLQYELLGKVGKEYDNIKIQQELKADLNKSELAFEKERLSIVENYIQQMQKLTTGNLVPGSSEFNTAAEANAKAYEDAMQKAEDNLVLSRTVGQSKANLNIAKNYQKTWDRIQDGITNALYTSLFEGGKKGAQSIRKLIEDELKREFVLPAIRAVVNVVTNAIGGTGGSIIGGLVGLMGGSSSSSSSSSNDYLGMASNANTLYNIADGTYLNTATGLYNDYVAGTTVFGQTAGYIGAGGGGIAGSVGAGSVAPVVGGSTGITLAGGTTGLTVPTGGGVGGAYGTAAPSTGSSAIGTVGWIAAIVAGMYMSSQAWKAGIRWENYAKDDEAKKYDAEVGIRALHDEPARAIFGDDFVDSEFYAVMGGGSLSAQIHGALQKAMWGGKKTPTGISSLMGAFVENGEGNSFVGQAGQQWKQSGGWFRGKDSQGVEWENVSDNFQDGMSKMYKVIRNSLLLVGDMFGDKTLAEKIQGFVSLVNVTNANNMEGVQEALANQIMQGLGERMFPSIGGLAKEGENKWSDVFARVMQEVSAVASVFDLLGKNLFDTFGIGNADRVLLLSDRFVQLFGTIESMNQRIGAYYSNFYTQAEQTAFAWEQMERQFQGIGQVMPTTREGFRDLVDSMDLSTEHGAWVFKMLMDMQDGFAKLTPQLKTIAEAAKEAADATAKFDAALNKIVKDQEDAVDKAYTALENAVNKERDLVQVRLDTLETQRDALSSFFDSLQDRIKELMKQSKVLFAMTAFQASSYLSDVLSSGKVTDIDKTSEAVDTLIEDFNKGTYATLQEEEITRAKLVLNLMDIESVAGKQLTEAERMIQLEQRQLADLDAILLDFKTQIDALNGINTSVLSVHEAILAMSDALFTLQAIKPLVKKPPEGVTASQITGLYRDILGKAPDAEGLQYWVTEAAKGATLGDITNNFVVAGTNAAIVESIYNTSLGRSSDAEGMAYWTSQLSAGVSPEQLKVEMEKSADYLASHADGGRYAGGLALVGEEGSELINFNRPGQVYTASQTQDILGGAGGDDNSALLEEMRGLRSEVEMLRYETRATASNTAKTAKLLDRNTDQDTIKVTIVADQTAP